MTLLATYETYGSSVLVGDALVTIAGSPSSLRKKVYIVGPNLVIGWTGYLRTARVVVFELLSRFWDKHVDISSLESTLCNLNFDGMSEFNVKIVGSIVDTQPRSFIWQSSYPKEVFYNDYYFEGSGEKYFESVLKFHILSGGDPPRPQHKFSNEVAAAQSTLVYCGQAFFDEVLAFENWTQTFGFAYEVLVYAYGKFWPLGPNSVCGLGIPMGPNNRNRTRDTVAIHRENELSPALLYLAKGYP
ncbi:MAG TPA: hypothetical protein VFH31_02695 [Pyrinomonadaceae bacterium]|nr:hypothetical protein [Pyrinomonadaceae bacterium]